MLEMSNQSSAGGMQYFEALRNIKGRPPIHDTSSKTGNTGHRFVSHVDNAVNSHSKVESLESKAPDILRRRSTNCFDGKDLRQRSGQVTKASHTSTHKLTESLKKGYERTVALCPESIKEFACSVKKGYKDHCPDVVQVLASRSVQKYVWGLTIQQLLVPAASAAISTVTSSGGEFVAQYCHPSAQMFQQKLLERLNGTMNVLDTSGEDIIKGLNDLFKDEPDLAIGGLHYLAAEKTIKENVVSYMEGTKIKTFMNYILDRAMSGVRNGTEPFRDLNHLIYDEAGDVTVLSDYMKRALFANCVPIDYSTIACGQITVGQFFQHLGDVFGMDTRIYEGAGSTTDLLAQLRLVKAVNPHFYEATMKMLDAKILHENVVSKATGERLYTVMEYVKDRLATGNGPKTISHVIHDELANQLKLEQDVAEILRPDCAPQLSPVGDAVTEVGSSAITAGLLGATAGGVITAAGIGGGVWAYRHWKSSGSSEIRTDARRADPEAGHENPVYHARAGAEGGGDVENLGMDISDTEGRDSMRSTRSTAQLVGKSTSAV